MYEWFVVVGVVKVFVDFCCVDVVDGYVIV